MLARLETFLAAKSWWQLAATSATGAVCGAVASWWHTGGPLFQYVLICLGCLFWLDTGLGAGCAIWLPGRKFSSRKFKRCHLKMVVYFSLIVLSFLIDGLLRHALGMRDSLYVVQIATVLSGVINEATSVLEHLKALEQYTGVKVPAFISDKLHDVESLIPQLVKGNPNNGRDEQSR